MDQVNGKSEDNEANAAEEAAGDLLATIDAVYNSLGSFTMAKVLSFEFFCRSSSLAWATSLLRLSAASSLWAGTTLFIRLLKMSPSEILLTVLILLALRRMRALLLRVLLATSLILYHGYIALVCHLRRVSALITCFIATSSWLRSIFAASWGNIWFFHYLYRILNEILNI